VTSYDKPYFTLNKQDNSEMLIYSIKNSITLTSNQIHLGSYSLHNLQKSKDLTETFWWTKL